VVFGINTLLDQRTVLRASATLPALPEGGSRVFGIRHGFDHTLKTSGTSDGDGFAATCAGPARLRVMQATTGSARDG